MALNGILIIPLLITTDTLTSVLGATQGGSLTASTFFLSLVVSTSLLKVNIPDSSCLEECYTAEEGTVMWELLA